MALNLGDFKITSTTFQSGGAIPDKCAKANENVSPHLQWSGAPEGTREFALICHDPDAPVPHGWTHWVLYGIPASVTELPESSGGEAYTLGGNDYGEQGWGGPMPPPGHGPHHYYFWVYALDAELGAEPGLSRLDLLHRLEGHVLEQARVIGTYQQ